MHSPDGSPLPLGQQLRRLLQPEALSAIPCLRLPRQCPCVFDHRKENQRLLGRELCHILKLLGTVDNGSSHVHGCTLLPICLGHVLRPNQLHNREHVYHRQTTKEASVEIGQEAGGRYLTVQANVVLEYKRSDVGRLPERLRCLLVVPDRYQAEDSPRT